MASRLTSPFRLGAARATLFLGLAVLLCVSGCKKAPKEDDTALDQAGMWFNSVEELRVLNVSNAEITELTKARQAGLSDQACIELVKLSRQRTQPFTDGQNIADLLNAGSSEQTVLELARLNQLGLWAGQAVALRLAAIPDKVILAVARRRSAGLPVLSGVKLGELKNAGTSDAMMLEMVEKGMSEKEVDYYIAQRVRAAGGHGFVHQGAARRR